MSTLNKYTFDQLAQIALLPVTGDSGALALDTSKRFGPFVAGDSVIVASTASFHVLAGDVTVAVTTSGTRLPAGVYKFSIPDACTHVAMIDSADGAGHGQTYKG